MALTALHRGDVDLTALATALAGAVVLLAGAALRTVAGVAAGLTVLVVAYAVSLRGGAPLDVLCAPWAALALLTAEAALPVAATRRGAEPEVRAARRRTVTAAVLLALVAGEVVALVAVTPWRGGDAALGTAAAAAVAALTLPAVVAWRRRS